MTTENRLARINEQVEVAVVGERNHPGGPVDQHGKRNETQGGGEFEISQGHGKQLNRWRPQRWTRWSGRASRSWSTRRNASMSM